jgi:hypothetical protein
MDFISELPESMTGHDCILVIVDKLTKYALFIPTATKLTELECARLFFKEVITKFGIPRQIITDRDVRWRGIFWNEICSLMGMKRALTTSYHPQADGQTEVMNQYLEIALRAYIGTEAKKSQWDEHLGGLALSFNSSQHSSTGFAPAYLLRGYLPMTSSTILGNTDAISQDLSKVEVADDKALELAAEFEAKRRRTQDSLIRAQLSQEKAYNEGRLTYEFEVGDLVVLNRDSLKLRRDDEGRGRKLMPKYKGPFEISEKISAVTYRLRMPASYGLHPVISIAHLERYESSPPEWKDRPSIQSKREGFDTLMEFEVEDVIGEKWRKLRNGRRERIYKVRYKGYGPEHDTWEPRRNLKNTPEVLKKWEE